MSDSGSLGREAEDRVADHLVGLGWTVVGRRVRTPHGEIDLVALDGDTLVLIEVKASATRRGLESRVTAEKVNRWTQAARDYVAKTRWTGESFRLDLVEVVGDRIRHIPDAIYRSESPRNEPEDDVDRFG